MHYTLQLYIRMYTCKHKQPTCNAHITISSNSALTVSMSPGLGPLTERWLPFTRYRTVSRDDVFRAKSLTVLSSVGISSSFSWQLTSRFSGHLLTCPLDSQYRYLSVRETGRWGEHWQEQLLYHTLRSQPHKTRWTGLSADWGSCAWTVPSNSPAAMLPYWQVGTCSPWYLCIPHNTHLCSSEPLQCIRMYESRLVLDK